MLFVRISRPVETHAPTKRPRRFRRWVVGSFLVCAGVVVLAIALGLVLLSSLDRPWLKSRIVGFVRTSAGVDIDYGSARIHLSSGAEVDGLVVRSPPAVRPFAPDLVRIGHLEARWNLRSLLRGAGAGPKVARVLLSDVVVSVVADERGTTSFDLLGNPSPPTPPVPLSQRARSILGSAPPVGEAAVERLALAYVQTEGGQVAGRTGLDGLELHVAMTAEPAEQGWRARGGLGASGSPRRIHLSREGAQKGSAAADVWIALDVTPSNAALALDLRRIEQSFVGRLSADHWVHAEARATFDAEAKKTELTVEHTEAGDGAVALDANVEVPDVGDPLVARAHAEVDIARLLRWLPPGLVPLSADRAHARLDVESLVVGAARALAPKGSATLNAEIANVSGELSTTSLSAQDGMIALRVEPAGGGAMTAKGKVSFPGTLRLALPGRAVETQGLALDLEGTMAAAGALSGQAQVRLGKGTQGGPSPIAVRDAKLEWVATAFEPTSNPLAARGDLAVTASVAALEANFPAGRAELSDLSVRAHTAPRGEAPYGAEVDARMSRFILARGGSPATFGAVHVEGKLADVVPVPGDLASSAGVAHALVEVGGVKATLEATKKGEAVDFLADVTAPTLTAVRPFVAGGLGRAVNWDRLALALHSKGHVERLAGGDVSLNETTGVHLGQPAVGDVSANALDLELTSRGDLRHHEAHLDVRAARLIVAGSPPVDDHAVVSVTIAGDRAALPSLDVTLATDGRATSNLSGSFTFDRGSRAVSYDVKGDVSGLGRLAPLAAKVEALKAIDLSELGVGVSARGAVSGLIDAMSPSGSVTWAPDPLATLRVDGKADVRVAHFRFSKGDVAIAAPLVSVHAETATDGAKRTVETKVECGSVHFDLGEKDLDLQGIASNAHAVVEGSLLEPQIELTQDLSIKGITQDIVPEYPLGDLSLTLAAERGRGGLVHVSDLKLTNGLGGTTVATSGNVDLSEGRRTLSVSTTVGQELDRLSTVPDRFKGSGKLGADATISSPDLKHFRVRAALKGEAVSIHLPRQGIDVDTANGEVPIALAVLIGPKGVGLERTEKGSPYSMLRFADQHPLLARSGFLSITSLKTPWVTIAPLVGNLEIEENVISLRQFEMGVRGGSITGQCALDWEGAKSTLELHVRASGVQSSHGEPFDGNIAVAISAADRTIEGRAEILRIGERHLLDLLDLQDPLHVDPGMNRIRTALVFGYPDHLRLVFDHGFASAHLELGGLARLIRIGELRGIPMGPIIDKALAPILDRLDTKGTP
jgi:hypothetical protein